MTATTARDRSRQLVIEIEEEFPVSPDRVFRRWTDAAALARWFAPPGYITLSSTADPRPGGAWRLSFRSEISRHEYTEQGTFRRVDPYQRLELTLTQIDGERSNPETLISVTFDDIGSPEAPRTRMRFTQDGYRSLSLFKDNEQGWRGCFAALAEDLLSNDSDSSQTDADGAIRALFQSWFDASERKDLDAQMAPIAVDVVSYEHNSPQEYRGIDAVRQVCAEGLDYQTGDFRWDIPDLQIRIVGDLAVTWGLNRMRNTAPDGTIREDWSRGTRIFENRDGRWQMIHQHVSFPIRADGRADTDR